MSRFLWSGAYAATAAYVVFHVHLYLWPDDACYERMSCGWSSPITSTVGGIGGLLALKLLTFASFSILGFLLASQGGNAAALIVLAFSVVMPGMPGLAIGPDALGAVGVLVLRRRSYWPLPFAFHMESALVLLVTKVGSRWLPVSLCAGIAGIGAIASQPILGKILHQSQGLVQYRYLLPALCLMVVVRQRPWSLPYSWSYRFSSLQQRSGSRTPEVSK